MRLCRLAGIGLILWLTFFFAGCAERHPAKHEAEKVLVIPPGFESVYDNMQFSAAVKVGNLVFVSGVTGAWMGGTTEEKARRAFQTIEETLQYAGAGLEDVVELVTYHKDMNNFQRFKAVKAEFFKSNYPAWTAVGTSDLVRTDAEVEIKVTAVIGSGKNIRQLRERSTAHEQAR